MNERATPSTAIPNTGGAIPQTPVTSASEEKPRVVVVEEEGNTGLDATALRRRRHRRRRSLKTDGPERRIRVFLLWLVVILLILAVTGAQAGIWLKQALVQIKPLAQSTGISTGIKSILRWEVLALFLAGLILLYLQPGVEDRVLRALGLKKERKRR